MTRLRARALLGGLGFAAVGVVGCGGDLPGGAPTLHDLPADPGQLRRAIRPTDGTGYNGNGYDNVPVYHTDSPGGRFRVFYTLAGESATSSADVDPMDGVPDFANRVAAAADQTWQSTVTARGFRPPLDDSVYHDRPDFGGDGRFDIYLRKIAPGSDGYRVTEVCTDVPFTCAGYFVMTPTFRGTGYKSIEEGAAVLTSHELFHAIQESYDARQWRTWTEGTAVWNETQAFPELAQRDFVGFLTSFLDAPERPFDKTMGTGPGGLYAYGAVLWPQFLGERFGVATVREIWQASVSKSAGQSPHFLDAADSVLRAGHGSDLATAWVEFTRWNALTGTRAGAGRGYARAATYPEARLEDPLRGLGEVSVSVDGLSARYLPVHPQLTAASRLRVRLIDESDTPATGTAYRLPPGGAAPTDELPFPGGRLDLDMQPGEGLLLVISGAVRGAAAHPVTLRIEAAPEPPPAGGGGCAIAHTGRSGGAPFAEGGPGLLGLLCAPGLLALLTRRRRRRQGRRRHRSA